MAKRSIIVSKYDVYKYRHICDPSNFSGGTRTEKFYDHTQVSIFINTDEEVSKNNLKKYYKEDNFERFFIYEETSEADNLFIDKLVDTFYMYVNRYKNITLYIDNLNEFEISEIKKIIDTEVDMIRKPKNRFYDLDF